MWPTPTDIKISQSVGPSSPPETPRTASPVFGRKSSPPRGQSHTQGTIPRPMAPPLSTGQPSAVNTRFSFSHSQALRPDQLSPRTTGSSSPSSSASDDSEDSDFDAPSPVRLPSLPDPPSPKERIGRVVTHHEFTVEELSDSGELNGKYAHLHVIRAYTIEYAESERSRSRSRPPAGLDQGMMRNFTNLNCSDSSSDESDMDDGEVQAMLRRYRAERRQRRMTSGSVSKRTISESIGSDTDREDLVGSFSFEDVNSTRRIRRKLCGDRRRGSFLFPTPPAPRIDELEEPDSSVEEITIGEVLARELPYYEYVTMEVDSS